MTAVTSPGGAGVGFTVESDSVSALPRQADIHIRDAAHHAALIVRVLLD